MSINDKNVSFSNSENKEKIRNILLTSLKILPVFILVLAMIGAGLNLRKSQDPRSSAVGTNNKINNSDRIKAINSEFLNYVKSTKGQAINQQSTDNLHNLAAERKQLMLSYLPDEPDKFLENLIPEDVKQNLPRELFSKNLIEKKETVKGKLKTTVYDDFEKNQARYEYLLNGLNLYISEKSGSLPYGDVTVNGYLIDNNLVVADPQLNVSYGSLNRYEVFGPQRTLMVIVDADYDPAEITTQALDTAIFGITSSAATYYKETSRNKMSLTGEVTKTTVNFSNVANKCYIYDLVSQTDSVLSQSGFILDDYRIIQYYLPKPPGCGWGFSGVALSDKRSVVAWNEYINKGISIHEIGHNFGLLHASTYNCGSKAFGTESECQVIEYGDNYDIMGLSSDNAPVFNGPHKLALSWIDENEYSFVKNDQELEIFAHEITDPGLKVVRIWRNVDDNYMYLSFRKKVGIDTVLPDTITRGVNVHLAQAISDSRKTLFIDVNPGEPGTLKSWYDASMYDGQILIDELSGIKITQVSHTVDKAIVQIDVPDNYPPKLRSANFNGLYQLPDGRWFAYENTLIQSLIFAHDFSDDITNISREVTYPDGFKQLSDMTVSPHVGSKLCEEIKCFDGTGGNFFTYQAGNYKLTFTARDSIGADSNLLVYEFIVGSKIPPLLTPTSTRTPTPTYIKVTPTLTPSINLTPKLTLTPTPTSHITLTPTPTGPIKITLTPTPTTYIPTKTPTITPALLKLEPVADSYVNSNYPNNNSGKETDLKVKTSPTKITFMKFDLTQLALLKFNSAKLKVWVNDPTNGTINLYLVPNNYWTETGITYNNKPALGNLILSFTTNYSGAFKEIDITNFIKSNPSKIVSFAFQTTSTNELSFKSRNIADTSRRPILIFQ